MCIFNKFWQYLLMFGQWNLLMPLTKVGNRIFIDTGNFILFNDSYVIILDIMNLSLMTIVLNNYVKMKLVKWNILHVWSLKTVLKNSWLEFF